MDYELTPVKPLITRKGGKDIKPMSKTTQTEAPKASKKYAKTRGEHIKDVVIAILITGVIAFGLGVKFQSDQNTEMQNAIKQASTSSAVAPEEPVKK